MPKSYWLPTDERTARAQTAVLRELREELEAWHAAEADDAPAADPVPEGN